MRFMPLVLGLALVAGTRLCVRSHTLRLHEILPASTLKTFEFKHQSDENHYRLSTIWESHSDGRTLGRS